MGRQREYCHNCRYATKDYTGEGWGLCANSISDRFTEHLGRFDWCDQYASDEDKEDEEER